MSFSPIKNGLVDKITRVTFNVFVLYAVKLVPFPGHKEVGTQSLNSEDLLDHFQNIITKQVSEKLLLLWFGSEYRNVRSGLLLDSCTLQISRKLLVCSSCYGGGGWQHIGK